jgi:hypothetical protein
MERTPVALSREVKALITPWEDERGGDLCHFVLWCCRPMMVRA